MDHLSDRELLAEQDAAADAFAVFYRRHVAMVLRFLARRGVEAQDAADLTAEAFAAAFVGRKRCVAEDDATSWLLGIVGHKLADHRRKFVRERRATARLGVEPSTVSAEDEAIWGLLRRAERDRDPIALRALEELPEAQRRAITARVIDERPHAEVAQDLGISTPTARQHVSRGLATLRGRLKGDR